MSEFTYKQNQMQRTGVKNSESEALEGFVDMLLDNRWVIAFVTASITLLGAVYSVVTPPIYEANLLIQVEDSAGSSQSILGNLAGAFDLKSAATAEMEILRSRFVVAQAVNNAQLDLTVKPRYFPALGRLIARRNDSLSQPGLLGIGGYVWGRESAELSQFDIPQNLENEKFVLTVTGSNRFVLTQTDTGFELSGTVGKQVVGNTPHGDVRIVVKRLLANAGAEFVVTRSPLLDTIEDLQKQLAISERGKQSGIIGISLQDTDPDKAATTLNEIGKQYILQNVERKAAEAEKSLAFLEKQLPEMKLQLEQAESKYNALRNSRGTVNLDEEAKSILQQSVLSQTKLLELKQKHAELLTRYQESNPIVQAIARQMSTLRDEIASVNSRIRAMPTTEQDILRLTRDVKVNTDLYTSLLNSAQQLRLIKASKVGNARVIDHAMAPLHPVKPKRAVVIAISSLAGIFFGVLLAFARKSLFGGVNHPHEIEELLGLDVTAAIPFSVKQKEIHKNLEASQKAVSILALDDPSDASIESLRSFRTALQFTMLKAKNNILMITGPTPGVGKSFVSVNFAVVLASSGKKILLIDADIRKGYLNQYFGLHRNRGLSDVISGELSFESAIHKDVVKNLDFVATGTLPPNPAEVLEQAQLKDILEAERNNYDYIVIDTAPVLAVADAMVVAPHAGTIFNIVRSGLSTIGQIEESIKRLQLGGNNVAGVVFNGLVSSTGRYGYGSKYGRYKYEQYKY